MAASTFERKIEITNPDAIARLTRVMSDETPRILFIVVLSPEMKETRVKRY